MGAFFRFDSCPRDDATLIKYSTSTSTTHSHPPPTQTGTTTTIPTSTQDTNTYHLQDIVDQYQSQPELLKMILYSKLQEDRRKTEEARLRVKQLDLYMSLKNNNDHSSSQNDSDDDDCDRASEQEGPNGTPPLSPPHPTLSPPPPLPPTKPSLDSQPSPSFLKPTPLIPKKHAVFDAHSFQQRKRRAMQPVTKIVETKDANYKDAYLWKNNGNTTQRKTGCKSTYYKCANANKGCPVNKTVNVHTSKGEYVIKYRGHHLSFCGQVEHICDL
ncbi:hypothetical protein BCR42DRAFT_410023 [Absidia repens]|uniref:WRKY domain-containing protein n=1 Tax=Absidia repens TaxID=90262 RepID=A0A1X2IPX3_9FUNG|nr:hypothetical protein BCR42DRAFT_410023 [Absidia repens]